jgi:ribonucleotide monophosphatase NagD (HAD superfamily)
MDSILAVAPDWRWVKSMTKALLLDLSGVLYEGDTIIAGALEAVQRVQDSEMQLRFVTNTSQKTRTSLLQHLCDFGFKVEEEQLFTAIDAARQWLIETSGPLWSLLGTRSEICLLDPEKVWGAFCSQFCVQFNIRIVHFEKQRSID